MKSSIISLAAAAATVNAGLNQTSSVPWTTSTLTQTNVYTITSCAPTVTNCPARIGQVTTEIYLTTTFCPVGAVQTPPSPPKSQHTGSFSGPPKSAHTGSGVVSTVYQTKEFTITSCAPTVTNCPVGSKTSSVLTFTTVIPHSSKSSGFHNGTASHPGKTASASSPSKAPASVVLPPASSKANSAVVPPPASTGKPSGPAVFPVQTISSCIPVYITSIVTVTATPAPQSKPASVSASGVPPPAVKPVTSNSVPSAPASKASSVSVSVVQTSSVNKVASGSSPAVPVVTPANPKTQSGAAAPSASKPASGSASPSGSKPASTPVAFTGGASAQKAGSLMVAVGLAAALL